MLQICSIIVGSYIFGSIPFGLIVAHLVKKIDIRKFGSGNIGAANVSRIVGKQWGIAVFILDFMKGFLPLIIAKLFLNFSDNYIFILISISSVCGHNWPVFLGFKGGKGVSTSVGAITGLSFIFPKLWMVLIISALIWGASFFIFRYVSLSSILLAISFFLFSFIFSLPVELKILSFIFCIFIILRHKKNIKSLFARQEYQFK